MAVFFLLLSTIFCWLTFGTHWNLMTREHVARPMYTYNPFLRMIPFICGIILPVIAWSYVFSWHWIILFFINLVMALLFARLIAYMVVGLLWRHRDPGKKALYFLIASLITLAIGISLHYMLA